MNGRISNDLDAQGNIVDQIIYNIRYTQLLLASIKIDLTLNDARYLSLHFVDLIEFMVKDRHYYKNVNDVNHDADGCYGHIRSNVINIPNESLISNFVIKSFYLGSCRCKYELMGTLLECFSPPTTSTHTRAQPNSPILTSSQPLSSSSSPPLSSSSPSFTNKFTNWCKRL